MSFKNLLFITYLCLPISYASHVFAQDAIAGHWYIDDSTAKIEIYKGHDSRYYGKIDWLKRPCMNGKQKIDIHNPDPCKRDRPFMGMVVLKGFIKITEGLYEKGTIYDPKTGTTYHCKMVLEGDTLYVRGFIGISLLGKSTVWTKAD
jgi:uncharacterized protein (DUF2147 family)